MLLFRYESDRMSVANYLNIEKFDSLSSQEKRYCTFMKKLY